MTSTYRSPRAETTRRMTAVSYWMRHNPNGRALSVVNDGDDVIIRWTLHGCAQPAYRVCSADIDSILEGEP